MTHPPHHQSAASASSAPTLDAPSLAESTADAVLTVDEAGTVVYANESIERHLGYAPADIRGTPVASLVPERFCERFGELADRYRETGERTVGRTGLELLATHADGHEVPLSVTLVEHDEDEPGTVSAVARPIESRLKREESLLRERERLRDALEAVAADETPVRVSLSDAAADGWTRVETGAESLSVDPDLGDVRASPAGVAALFGALFAGCSSGPEGTVSVEPVDGGFVVAADAVATDLLAAEAVGASLGWDVSRREDVVYVSTDA